MPDAYVVRYGEPARIASTAAFHFQAWSVAILGVMFVVDVLWPHCLEQCRQVPLRADESQP